MQLFLYNISMNITIIAVGKLKEAYWREAVAEYSKRLSHYCKLTIVELPDEQTPDHASAALTAQIIDREGERILRAVPQKSYLIALAIEGKTFDSISFANKLSDLALAGSSDFTFVIGGSLGLSSAVLNRADMRLSFSQFTFPHQLMRIILLEQIYRAFRIQNHEPYHK